MPKDQITESKIPTRELKAFYQLVGKNIAEWLSSLECPNCKEQSDLDWLLKPYSNGKPQLICRHCFSTYQIKGLKFKRIIIQAEKEQLPLKKLKALNGF